MKIIWNANGVKEWNDLDHAQFEERIIQLEREHHLPALNSILKVSSIGIAAIASRLLGWTLLPKDFIGGTLEVISFALLIYAFTVAQLTFYYHLEQKSCNDLANQKRNTPPCS